VPAAKPPQTFTRYGLTWYAGNSDLDVEFEIISQTDEWRKQHGLTLFDHYKAAQTLLWPDHDVHRWSDLGLRSMVENDVTVLMGCSDCVAGETRILNPITGEQPTIRYLCENRIAPTVMTLNGPRIASVPFFKGEDELFEVTCENGIRFTGTGHHVVLTSSGYRYVCSLQVQDVLLGYDVCRLPSTGDICPSIQMPDGDRCYQTPEDFLVGCHPSFCFCDAQPRRASTGDQAYAPLPIGVQQHTEDFHSFPSWHVDAQVHIRKRNPCSSFALHATSDCDHLDGFLETVCGHHSVSTIHARECQWTRPPDQYPPRNNLLEPSSTPSPDSWCIDRFASVSRMVENACGRSKTRCVNPRLFPQLRPTDHEVFLTPSRSDHVWDSVFRQKSSRSSMIQPTKVASIKSVGRGEFFDMKVPDEHHYFAEGAIHHNSGKTFSMAKFVLTDWWARPDKAIWLVSSTELRGAELRIWGVLKDLFNQAREIQRGLPGTVLEHMHAITTDAICTDNSEGRLLTKGIVFVPAKRGQTFIGLGAFQGIKPQPGGRLGHAGDELSAMPAIFLDVYANFVGKENFKSVMSGNPFDLDDTLCRAAEPLEGWDSWHDTGKTQTWRSKFYNAQVVAFDGRDSPNFDYPPDQPTRYKYLIGRKKIEAVGRTHGKDSWQWFMQCVGKPRPGAVARRVVTRAMCETYHAFDEVTWLGEPTIKIGFLDAAYGGMGGDRCIAGYIEFGKDVNGHVVIACHPFVLVPVKVNRFVLPEDQIANFIRDYMQSVKVEPQNFFFDGRGSLAVALSRLWSPKVEAVEFGGRATERPVSNDTFMWDGDRKTRRLQRCDELYSRFVTELWFAVHMVIISDQMRQLPQDVAAELCRREWDYVQNGKIEVETKEEMKLRTGESPDLADCFSGDTLVATDNGPVPIESIQLGDMVKTPFGSAPVIARHVSHVTETTSVHFSNGAHLTGKGKHKVFTWDNGWVKMSDLSLTTTNESEHNAPLWDWLNASFTRVGNTGFKALVDTIQTGTTMRLRDFYTELSGRSTLVVSLKVIASIIKTVIGQIIGFPIWSLCRVVNTCRTIFESGSIILNIVGKMPANWIKRGLEQAVGINHQQAGNGTVTCPNEHGWKAKGWKGWLFAKSAVESSQNISINEERCICVLKDAKANAPENDFQLCRAAVLCAVRNLRRHVTVRQRLVPIAVEQHSLTVPVKVYNLTLAEHNAYYANGILVDNCLVTGIEGARRRGFQIARLPGKGDEEDDDSWKLDLRLQAQRLKKSYSLTYS
jgi:hypothetical protein